ncbi:unnamed protein product [Paramecium sonneborni]|uniref:60S ribosomal protein L27 n=1 Tax=Paramecium sonneborni TaxID=65129 RepID=A0A8S1KJG1_9CILI|nr:unnamed protein product [Paramecium sonneborni]
MFVLLNNCIKQLKKRFIQSFEMGKFLKPGRLIVMLAGRYAGKKAILIKANEETTKDCKFPNGLVVGIQRYPRKVTKRMGQKQIRKRTTLKVFIKQLNLNHIMPTRYRLEESTLKEVRDRIERVKESELKNVEKRKELRKNLRKYLAEKYRTLPAGSLADKKAQSRFLFSKLRF